MTSGQEPAKTDRRPERKPTSRRSFLAFAAGAGVASLAGCAVRVDRNGITWGDAATTPASRTTTETATTATETPTRTTTETTTEPEFEVVEMQTEDPEYVLVTTTPPVQYRVHNVRLFVPTANDSVFDGPNTEEVYGDVYVRGYDGRDGSRVLADGYTARSGLVYSTGPGDAVELREHERAHRLPIDVVVSFPDPGTIDRSSSYIEVGGDLFEKDTASDDVLGLLSTGSVRRWSLAAAPTDPTRTDRNREATFVVGFSDRGSVLRLSFDVSPVE
jgi:hypothetical protein